MAEQTEEVLTLETEEGPQAADVTVAAAPEETPAEDAPEADQAEEEGTAEDKTPDKPADNKPAPPPSTLEAITNDPYDFDRCQVQVSILFLPRSGEDPRLAVVGVKTHDDDPLIEAMPGDEIMGTLPIQVLELLDRVKAQMPTRAMNRMAKKAAPTHKKRPAVAPAKPSTGAAHAAPVQAPNAPAIAAATQTDMFGMLGGGK